MRRDRRRTGGPFERDVIPLLDTLFAGAMRMTLQRNDAEDLVQETMAVYYADVEGLVYEEIRDIMGPPLGAVVSRIQRGRSRLLVMLADLAADRGYLHCQQHAAS